MARADHASHPNPSATVDRFLRPALALEECKTYEYDVEAATVMEKTVKDCVNEFDELLVRSKPNLNMFVARLFLHTYSTFSHSPFLAGLHQCLGSIRRRVRLLLHRLVDLRSQSLCLNTAKLMKI